MNSILSINGYDAKYRVNYYMGMFLFLMLCISCNSSQEPKKPTVAIVTWDDSAKEGRDVGSIRVYQLGEPVSGLKVKVKYQGTASDGFDYRSNNNEFTVDKYKEIGIKPISDGLTEGNEEVIIRLVASDDYIIDKEHSEASLIILDNALPDIEFAMPGSINNEAKENAEIKLRLSEISKQEIKLSYTVQGILAEEGKDFQFDSYSLLIPPGEKEVTIDFKVNDDTIAEDDETVVIRLTEASNANIGEMESHYFTIKNDDGQPIRSVVHDKIYGALIGFRAGCAMGAITEYNWPQDRIQEIFGFQDKFLPYKHYGGAWTHPAGATEDGGERHKLIATAIIEKQDRINYQDLKKVWLRDAEIMDMYNMTQNYDRVLLAYVKWGVAPEDLPITKFGTPKDLGEHIHLTARTFQALPSINAGDPENAIADMNEMGKFYYEDPNDDAFAWGAVYNAAMALAMLPDATVDSVIEDAMEYATPEIEKEIRHALAITEKYEDPMNRAMWQELSDMYMEPDSKYYAFNRIEKYPNSSIYENVSFAFALFKATNANVKQTVLIAVNRGYDADCTAASAGALSGALSGTSDIPIEWIETLDSGIINNPYTNAHFTNKATADGLYSALQHKISRMEKEANTLKINSDDAKKIMTYVDLMRDAGVY